MAVGNCCYVTVCSVAEGASTPTGGGEGLGHTVAAARLQLVLQETQLAARLLLTIRSYHMIYLVPLPRQTTISV